MCLFPVPNLNINGSAYLSGIKEFNCGTCPECLQKKSSLCVVRDIAEASYREHTCMCTLTYDNYIRDSKGHIIGETPVNPDLSVCKRDVQLFIKRLRAKHPDINLKYRIRGEYGSKTHRAHYHVILFGYDFPDRVFLKKSKRGNRIYMSPELTKTWGLGLCTVDCVCINSAIVRYCTKYINKINNSNEFMLSSTKLGIDYLMDNFNGLNYVFEGREYPIPRVVWQEYIMRKYSAFYPDCDYRYVNKTDESLADGSYQAAALRRSVFRAIRNSDKVYCDYLNYWKTRAAEFEKTKPSVRDRIISLPDCKYHFYKLEALFVLNRRLEFTKYYPAPRSHQFSGYLRYLDNIYKSAGFTFSPFTVRDGFLSAIKGRDDILSPLKRPHLPSLSCLNTASDSPGQLIPLPNDDPCPFGAPCIERQINFFDKF